MKMTGRTVLITIAVAALSMTWTMRAAHVAEFLDPLHAAVSNRIANTELELTSKQVKALQAADRTLKRESKTLAADAGLLSTAARTLNARFTDDGEFIPLENQAIVSYWNTGQSLLDQAIERLGTNTLTRGASNKLVRAQAALDNVEQTTNSVWRQARALSSALKLVDSATKPIFAKYTNSVPEVPPGPTAPTNIYNMNIDAYENAPVNEQTKFFFRATGYYNADFPEELGRWQYVQTGPNTGVINITRDWPQGAPGHQLQLVFQTPTTGTFTGADLNGSPLQGTFFFSDPPPTE